MKEKTNLEIFLKDLHPIIRLFCNDIFKAILKDIKKQEMTIDLKERMTITSEYEFYKRVKELIKKGFK